MSINKGKKVQVVVYADNKVLLLRTNQQRGSFWQNITGSVEGRESFLDAAKRESIEELGLNLIPQLVKLEHQFEYIDQNRQIKYCEQSFLYQADKHFSPQLDPNEHMDFRWVELNNITSEDYKYESNYQAFVTAKHFLSK